MVRGAVFNKAKNEAYCTGHSKCNAKCLLGKGSGYCSFIVDALNYNISNIECPRYIIKDYIIQKDDLGFNDGKDIRELVA